MNNEDDAVFYALMHTLYYITKYFLPIFLWSSLIGNSLSVYILFCTKIRNSSSSIYLGALAMSDIGVLGMVFIDWMDERGIISFEFWSYIVMAGMQMSFSFLSVWIIMAFTVQRYVAIKWPLLSRSLCTVDRTKVILIGLTLLGILHSMPMVGLFLYAYRKSGINLTEKDEENLVFIIKILKNINAITRCFLPATIAIFNILIIYIIRKQNRIRRNMILRIAASNNRILNSSDERSHIKTTKMLVIISSTFVLLNVPIQVCCSFFGYRVRINIYC